MRIIILLMALVLMIACDKEDPIEKNINNTDDNEKLPPEINSLSAINIWVTEATVQGKVIYNESHDNLTAGFYYSKTAGLVNDYDSMFFIPGEDTIFTANLTDLNPDTRYYYTAVAKTNDTIFKGEELYFDTQSGIVEIELKSPGGFSPNSFNTGGAVIETNGAKITELGICWNTEPLPDTNHNVIRTPKDSLSYSVTVNELASGHIYYVRAYAKTVLDVFYSDEVEIDLSYFIDSRDGKVYKYVTIGNQTWMAENLAYLPEICDVGGWCGYYVYDYEGTDTALAKQNENYKEYGVLYSFSVAKDVCPSGWHLPSDAEWKTLEGYLKNNGYGSNMAKALKSTNGWQENGNGTNALGFNAKPAGMKNYIEFDFTGIKTQTLYWSSTSNVGEGIYCRKFVHDSDDITTIAGYKDDAYSIRCLKDN